MQLLVALMALLPSVVSAEEPVQLAKWTFDTGYTVEGNVYTPNSDAYAESGSKWFSAGAPVIVANESVGSATDYTIDLQQVDHALPAGMEATEDGKLVGTPTKRGVYPILVWATITLADGTEKQVAEVFDIEVYDPNYETDEEAPAPTPEVEGLPLAAIIGISVGGGVLVLAGGFALVWFLVIKKGKKEAKAE